MKRKTLILLAAATLMLSGCGMTGQSGLGGILGNSETIGNVITSVLGLTKVSQRDIIGNWSYYQPGCAFTTEQLLKKAGGELAAAEIKTKVKPYYDKAGVSAENTKISFGEDGRFTAVIAGKQFSGTYTYDEAQSKISMKSLLFTVNCYAKKNAGSMAFLFESSKLLTVLQGLSAISGSTELQTIGELAKQYDGVRIGFDMK